MRLLILGLLMIGVMLASLLAPPLLLSEWLTGLSTVHAWILWELRLPRLLAALSLGAGLAVSGVALQALFRNPLAEPGLIGVSSGAALGAVIALLWLPVSLAMSVGGLIWQGMWAFGFGLLTTWLLYRLATQQGRTDAALMLLAGVAFNAINGAGVSLLITLSNDSELRTIVFWMMGSLSGINWGQAMLLTGVFIFSFAGLWRLRHGLDLYLLGERVCRQMGHDPQRIKLWVITLTTLFIGVAVSMVGVIAFVGLVVPHMMRLWVGARHQVLLPASALGGAVLMAFADFIAHHVMTPSEVPIGLFMALLGGPFFLYLLLRERKKLGI
ncbi:FecCD family ABC transporter permease [Galenea microaerophila]